MNSKTIVPSSFLSKARELYNTVTSIFHFNPTETIRAQIRERNPNLSKQEIDQLTEEEVQRFFSEYYIHMHLPPM
ncbi:MAG: hypothetical protein KTR30_18545 [Saprospiraceae bacterium]|nr:hypothetical protein [Saprospiraceae bacterium]